MLVRMPCAPGGLLSARVRVWVCARAACRQSNVCVCHHICGTTISSVPSTCVPDVVLNSAKEIVENRFYILDLTAEGVSGVERV